MSRPLVPTTRLLRDLGTQTDTALAAREDVSVSWVRLLRSARGIPPYRRHGGSAELLALVAEHPGSLAVTLAHKRGRSRQATNGLLQSLAQAGLVRRVAERNPHGGGPRARWYPQREEI